MRSTTGARERSDDGPARRRGTARALVVAVILLTGLLATGLGALHVGEAPGLFVGRVEVVVHPPPSPTVANPLVTQNFNAVRLAGLLTEVATNGEEVPRVTAQDLTLADQGMHRATVIQLTNLGGQWANDFSRPFIRIEAVDTTRGAVLARLDEAIARVDGALDDLQRAAAVQPDQRATTEAVPAVPQVRYESTHGRRAVLAALLLGLVVTVSACRTAARGLSRASTGDAGRRPLPDPTGGPESRASRSPGARAGAGRPGALVPQE